MNTNIKRLLSIGVMLVGILAMAFALYLDIMGSKNTMRGTMLIVGALLVILGLYSFPTKKHRMIINVLFLFPLLFAFFVTVLIPFVCGVFYSFTNWNGIKFTEFVGLGNYISMFKSEDYVYSFIVTFIFTVVNMILVNSAAFALALFCTSKVKGKNFYRAAFFIPNLIGGIVLGYVWQFIFNKVFTVVINGSASMLTNPNLALMAILIVSTWQYAGYIMMIYVTGLQNVPQDILEASSVDGASGWITLLKIKIPMIANTFTVCIFLTLVNSFKQFDLNLAITNGAPSRILNGDIVQSTEFLALNIYNTAIGKNQYALGQTKAVIFFIILAVVSLTQVYISKKKEVEV
ncbi:carbohydrate ABC transporter permease [Clostridium beijerinckii]|uniref:carbohydrate ABC transporter permease n=1 Tax=Clostridium beijerinckii TaxID=1520 RepID=UPI001494E3F2|nr:sugar ABC transporter permease [Clostridium beijerinckii]NOW02997.1 raffinose/stachyose/melibiose transport system permease protein [Clostridium beijerinckii]NYC03862.1 raffinose/stachyose/melibiose transport system permease protein [Clostridium beijerinckii]